jgi:hypothetical protein
MRDRYTLRSGPLEVLRRSSLRIGLPSGPCSTSACPSLCGPGCGNCQSAGAAGARRIRRPSRCGPFLRAGRLDNARYGLVDRPVAEERLRLKEQQDEDDQPDADDRAAALMADASGQADPATTAYPAARSGWPSGSSQPSHRRYADPYPMSRDHGCVGIPSLICRLWWGPVDAVRKLGGTPTVTPQTRRHLGAAALVSRPVLQTPHAARRSSIG